MLFREEELREALEPLAVSTRRFVRMEFSWGGPSSYMDLEVDGYEVVGATFHFLDWFDRASRPIGERSNPAGGQGGCGERRVAGIVKGNDVDEREFVGECDEAGGDGRAGAR